MRKKSSSPQSTKVVCVPNYKGSFRECARKKRQSTLQVNSRSNYWKPNNDIQWQKKRKKNSSLISYYIDTSAKYTIIKFRKESVCGCGEERERGKRCLGDSKDRIRKGKGGKVPLRLRVEEWEQWKSHRICISNHPEQSLEKMDTGRGLLNSCLLRFRAR